jgi:ABC-type sugar transport system ATPase subunit
MLSASELTKSYAGVKVVNSASVEVASGEVHALIGENGAGKSTMLRMIAGLVRPDSGTITVADQDIGGRGTPHSLKAGVAMVSQEMAAIPSRSVIENVYLGVKTKPVGTARANFGARYEQLCAETGIWLNPGARVFTLSQADRQQLEILRALAARPRVLLLDEPTTAMSFDQSARFAELIRELARQGMAVLWVSHDLTEVRGNAQRVTVMRDGSVVGGGAAEEFTESDLIQLMVGYEVAAGYPRPDLVPAGAPSALQVRDLRCFPGSPSLSVTVAAGEIVGCAGLVGAGRSSFGRALYGARPPAGGQIKVGDGPWFTPKSTRQAAAAGIAMVPEDRRTQGLVLNRSVAENLLLPSLDRITRLGVVERGRARSLASAWVRQANVRPPDPSLPVASLSGGNQQKVLVQMRLATEPKLVIFDEPTRGVSIDAKVELHRVVVEMAGRGMGVILISSELDEVLGLSHRVLVFRNGSIVSDLDAEHATRQAVMSAAFGLEGETGSDER